MIRVKGRVKIERGRERKVGTAQPVPHVYCADDSAAIMSHWPSGASMRAQLCRTGPVVHP